MRVVTRTITALLFGLLWSALAYAQSKPPTAPQGPYVLFIHSGPKKAADPVVKGLAVVLVRQGYLVREPVEDRDNVGGPGVDYFAEESRGKAQDVADAVNDYLGSVGQEPGMKLQPRKQRLPSPSQQLGVWLY